MVMSPPLIWILDSLSSDEEVGLYQSFSSWGSFALRGLLAMSADTLVVTSESDADVTR